MTKQSNSYIDYFEIITFSFKSMEALALFSSQWKSCTVIVLKHLSRDNQYVSYSVLLWKGRMDIDGSGSKGTIYFNSVVVLSPVDQVSVYFTSKSL